MNDTAARAIALGMAKAHETVIRIDDLPGGMTAAAICGISNDSWFIRLRKADGSIVQTRPVPSESAIVADYDKMLANARK